jgi:hypothetical protein
LAEFDLALFPYYIASERQRPSALSRAGHHLCSAERGLGLDVKILLQGHGGKLGR